MPFEVTIERDADIEALSPEKARKAVAERSEVLAKVFEEAGEDVDHTLVRVESFKSGSDLVTYIRKMNDELSKIGVRVQTFDTLADARDNAQKMLDESRRTPTEPQRFAPKPDAKNDKKVEYKSFGQSFLESDFYKAALVHSNAKGELKEADAARWLMESKTAFTTAAGWAPESLRIGRVVLDQQRPIEITDVIPSFPTGRDLVKFMEETTFTNNSAERAENAAYAEGALALTEQSDEVESVGVSLSVTDEQLEDVEGVAAYLDQRLGFMVRQRLDPQIIQGNGSTPNLLGTMNKGSIQTQAKGADSVPDAVYNAITLVRHTGFAEPSVVLMHPNDWQTVRLLTTADGVYIWGSPASAGPEMIWGVPVIVSSALTENTGIVGDYSRFSGLFLRRGLTVETGYVNDDFLDGRQTIRAGLRVAMVHFRAAAFCTVTGI